MTQPEILGENGIALGSLDHVQEAEIGEPRAAVLDDVADHACITARHQHVGDGFIERFPLRDGEQMLLALGAGVFDQGFGIKLLGFAKHGTGDCNLIVKGKLADDVEGRTVETGEPAGELGARGDLDLIRQPSDDFAEGRNFLVAVTARDQHVGRMPQGPRAAFVGAAQNRVVEIREIGFYIVHLAGPGPSKTRKR